MYLLAEVFYRWIKLSCNKDFFPMLFRILGGSKYDTLRKTLYGFEKGELFKQLI